MTSRQTLSRRAKALQRRLGLSYDHLLGFRYAVNVFIATTIVWSTLKLIGDSNPIWAIASMVAASDPQPEEARRLFRSRLVNVLVGCVVGLGLLLIGGHGNWKIPFALALTVLISSYVIRIKTMWRQAPITAAIVIAAGISQGSKVAGIESGLHKVAEVFFGCVVGLVVSWLTSKLWLIQPTAQEAERTGNDAIASHE
jgi:uncharacterized membrane protein YccC